MLSSGTAKREDAGNCPALRRNGHPGARLTKGIRTSSAVGEDGAAARSEAHKGAFLLPRRDLRHAAAFLAPATFWAASSRIAWSSRTLLRPMAAQPRDRTSCSAVSHVSRTRLAKSANRARESAGGPRSRKSASGARSSNKSSSEVALERMT